MSDHLPLLGAHMSIAGGYFKAVDAAAALGMATCQLFTKSNSQWRAKPLTREDVQQFRDALERHQIAHPLSHSSYLINLASPQALLWEKSIEGLVIELERAETLGIPYVVVHPGACTSVTEAEGIDNVVRALDEVHRRLPRIRCSVLLETTAGQGSCVGWRFEHLEEILQRTREGERLGVCLDTCHIHAAGYSLNNPTDFKRVWKEFDQRIGIERLRAIHVNDSKRELGSRVDRHAHIGQGHLGLEPFRLLVNDRRLRKIPMYLETAKGLDDQQRDWDAVNLATLRGLVLRSPPKKLGMPRK